MVVDVAACPIIYCTSLGLESRLHQSRAADVPQRMRGQHDGMVWTDNRIEAIHRGFAGVVDDISV